MITFETIKKDETIRTYIKKADESLAALGYTEHSFAHVGKVAQTAKYILEALEMPAHTVELAQIAGYTHDIGNLVNRVEHSQSGAIMMFRLLDHKDINELPEFKGESPSSEMIAGFIYHKLKERIVQLSKISVWETQTSCASYFEED